MKPRPPVAVLAGAPRQISGPRGGAGSRLARWVESQVLAPLERVVPAAAPLVKAARNCGGCKGDAARLDGDGGGAKI